MAKSLKQAYDYWQNQPDLNCVSAHAHRKVRACRALMILMLYFVMLTHRDIHINRFGNKTNAYTYIVFVYIHAAWLLTSCLAEIPQNAATIKCSFCFNRVSAASVNTAAHTKHVQHIRIVRAALAVAGHHIPLGRSRRGCARGVLSNKFEATHSRHTRTHRDVCVFVGCGWHSRGTQVRRSTQHAQARRKKQEDGQRQ